MTDHPEGLTSHCFHWTERGEECCDCGIIDPDGSSLWGTRTCPGKPPAESDRGPVCEACNGRGDGPWDSTCQVCDGTGVAPQGSDSSVVSEPCRDVLRVFYGDICCRRERGHEGNHRGVSGYDSRYVYWTPTESEQCAPESDSSPTRDAQLIRDHLVAESDSGLCDDPPFIQNCPQCYGRPRGECPFCGSRENPDTPVSARHPLNIACDCACHRLGSAMIEADCPCSHAVRRPDDLMACVICEAIGCDRPADWVFIGEGESLFLCERHGGH